MIRQRKEEYIMNMDERIKRINELYHKSQSEGLTDEESWNSPFSDRNTWTASSAI